MTAAERRNKIDELELKSANLTAGLKENGDVPDLPDIPDFPPHAPPGPPGP